jgi:regulator of replication initiation timing
MFIFENTMKNLKIEIEKLKDKIFMLEIENERLKLELQSHKEDWIHPQSCLHNSDPWKIWKDK